MKQNATQVSSHGTLTLATLYRLFGGISAFAGATKTVQRTSSLPAEFAIGRRRAA